MAKRWSLSEIEFLRANFLKMTDHQLAERIGRSEGAVYSMRQNLGLKKGWGTPAISYLNANYKVLDDKALAEHLGRTLHAVKWKRRQLGLLRKRDGFWTEEEVDVLKVMKNESVEKVAQRLARSRRSVHAKRRSLNLTNPGGKYSKSILHKVNEEFFSEWTCKMAYILGIIFADGYIQCSGDRYRFGITSKDHSLVMDVKETMGADHPIQEVQLRGKGRTSQTYFSLTVSRKEMVEDLVNLGLKPNKSLTMEFPEIPKTYFWHFVRGYFDGDGHVSVRKGHSIFIAFYSGSRKFLEELAFQLDVFGIPTTMRKDKRHTTYCLSVLRPGKFLFYKMLYNEKTLYLERKFRKMEEYFASKRITCAICSRVVYRRSSSQRYCPDCSPHYKRWKKS